MVQFALNFWVINPLFPFWLFFEKKGKFLNDINMYEDTINWRKWSQLDPIKKRNSSLEKDKYNVIRDQNQIEEIEEMAQKSSQKLGKI